MRQSLLTTVLLGSVALSGMTMAQTTKQTAKQTQTVAKAAAGPVTSAKSDKPQIGDFGFDVAGMDRSVKPGNDFVEYAGGDWFKETTIPQDKSSYSMFNVLNDLSLERTKGILEADAKTPGNKAGDFYASFMDEAAVNAKGIKPVQPMLDAINAATDKPALASEMAKLQRQGVGDLFGVGVGQDDKQPTDYIVGFYQSGLGLPDRDYYLKDDAKLAEARTQYQAYLTTMLGMTGADNAQQRAAAVFTFEKALAQAHWTRIESRDADKTYNKWMPADFAAKAPGFPWSEYLPAAGVAGQSAYLVAQPTAVAGEAKVFAATPLPVLKDFMALKVMRANAPYLAQPIYDAYFKFYGTDLSGTPEQLPRWKRAVTTVNGGVGELVGQQYVAKYFPPEAKATADQLVKNIIAAMGARIDKLTWMAPQTKVRAHEKLASFMPKIGYPSKWRDYSALTIDRGDLVKNVAAANQFDYQYDLNKLGKPIDRTEWGMTPMTVNAYANPTMNEIVFPAAILQPPFFDPNADAAVNYGGIGVVIGHELSHHFDDQGRKFDKTGKLTDWWTPQDVSRFNALTEKLVKQYDAYQPIPGQHIQGGLTLGENMADLAGLAVSHDAYERSLNGNTAPVVDGMTGDQRFYLGYSQVWRVKYREPQLRSQLLSDPHSPGPYRTNEVRNIDAWYKAFDVKPGQALYLAPENRVRVW